jgi:hydroxymethylglutaryl-CoA reductase (NADPH)
LQTWFKIHGNAELHQFGRLTENYLGNVQYPLCWFPELHFEGVDTKPQSIKIPWAGPANPVMEQVLAGMEICNLAGGLVSMAVEQAVQRSPVFVFDNLQQAFQFSNWVAGNFELLSDICKATSRYCKLLSVRAIQEGNLVNLLLNFGTADAAGQNMVTIVADAIGKHIRQNQPGLQNWYIESNLASDKKTGPARFIYPRGHKVIARVSVPDSLLAACNLNAGTLINNWQTKTLQGILAPGIGNIEDMALLLAPVLLATGQDVACISESAVGLLRLELGPNNHLIINLTLPGLLLGTVGGGTTSPAAQRVLQNMDCAGPGKAHYFASAIGAYLLAAQIGKLIQPYKKLLPE